MARALDLDHVGAEIGQQLRAPRTREHARQVEHSQMPERFHRAIGDRSDCIHFADGTEGFGAHAALRHELVAALCRGGHSACATSRRIFAALPSTCGCAGRNRNYVGTHFGGSLYAMVDPFLMVMLLHNLGGQYRVWDKSGSIEYLAPGRGRVWARLDLADKDLEQIRHMTEAGDKHLHLFSIDIKDDEGMVVARVEKVIYIRRKRNTGENGDAGS